MEKEVSWIQYFWPSNAFAEFLVVVLTITFGYWILKFISTWRELKQLQQKINSCRDVTLLINTKTLTVKSTAEVEAGANKKKNVPTEETIEPPVNPDLIFENFCKKKEIPIDSPLAEHVRMIYHAGLTDNRLDVGELLKHTTSSIFRNSNLLKGILASFIIVGLLGTLIGLADSLAELLPSGSTSGEQASISMPALVDLLTKLKGAFAPSICGVLFTVLGMIGFTIYLQAICNPLKNTLDQLTLKVWMPKLFPTTTQKMLETLELSEEQMQKNFEAAKEVAVFAKTIKTDVVTFGANLEKTTKSMDTVNNSSSQFGQVVNRFAKSVDKITSFQEEIKGLYEQLIKDSGVFKENVDTNVQQAIAFQKDTVQVFHDHNEQVKALIKELDAYESDYIAKRQLVDTKISEVLNEAREAFNATSAKDRLVLEAMGNLVGGKIDTNLGELSGKLESSLGEISGRLESNLGAINEKLINGLTEIQMRFNSFDIPMNKAADQIAGALETVVRRTETITRELQKAFKDSTEEMNNRVNKQLVEYANQNKQLSPSDITALNSNLGNLAVAIKVLNERLESSNFAGRKPSDLSVWFEKLWQAILRFLGLKPPKSSGFKGRNDQNINV
jgi:hypothetical protein